MSILKKKVFSQNIKKLTASWKNDVPVSEESTYVHEMAKIIREEMDWEIKCEMLKVSENWTTVTVRDSIDMYKHGDEVEEWVNINCKGDYLFRSRTWIFKDKEDATWFSLKWS